MPIIIFESPSGNALQVDTDGGVSLMDVCDEALAPVEFSCRSTTCGTCGVWVEQGQDLLEPPNQLEQSLRKKLGGSGQRFACAMQVRRGNGLIRLRVCGRFGS